MCWEDIDFEEDFNPRPLAGATGDVAIVLVNGNISIHAPLRGRLAGALFLVAGIVFQSTPPCGGDGVAGFLWVVVRNFNPRPLAGAT